MHTQTEAPLAVCFSGSNSVFSFHFSLSLPSFSLLSTPFHFHLVSLSLPFFSAMSLPLHMRLHSNFDHILDAIWSFTSRVSIILQPCLCSSASTTWVPSAAENESTARCSISIWLPAVAGENGSLVFTDTSLLLVYIRTCTHGRQSHGFNTRIRA